MSTYRLSEPTVFPDLNRKNDLEEAFETTDLKLNTLKYKHFRSIMKLAEADQMHHLMMAMSGLSENDMGELTPHDAAEISSLVYESMSSYMQLGKKIVRNLEDK